MPDRMKPHEEEWEMDGDPTVVDVNTDGALYKIASFDDPRRARLAAQAPAMAQWMLGAPCEICFEGDCPSCMERKQILRDAGVIE